METIDGILDEVDKLPLSERLRLLHKLVDRIVVVEVQKPTSQVDFNKCIGVGKHVWETDAQAYINSKRDEDRF